MSSAATCPPSDKQALCKDLKEVDLASEGGRSGGSHSETHLRRIRAESCPCACSGERSTGIRPAAGVQQVLGYPLQRSAERLDGQRRLCVHPAGLQGWSAVQAACRVPRMLAGRWDGPAA